MPSYSETRDRVETYFDQTATETWAKLTSDAPVSRIRETVRQGRDRMRGIMLDALGDVKGKTVLDAGCGTGAMTRELADRGAEVVACDISPALINIAEIRLPERLKGHVRFEACDMLQTNLGAFDHVVAMDSLIYYGKSDLERAIDTMAARTSESLVFTLAPRTPFLMAFWGAGRLFPRKDRSPTMIPQNTTRLTVAGKTRRVERVTSGFYISECMEVRL